MAVVGTQAVLQAIGKARSVVKQTIAEGLEGCARIILAKSQTLVPVDLGPLKASGRVEVSEGSGLAARASVIYGGTEYGVDYAWWVHENLDKHHPIGQAKYLEDAIRAVRGTCAAKLKRTLKVGAEGVDWVE